MGDRLRSLSAAFVLAVILASAPAHAQEFTSCWVTTEADRYGIEQQITRCRISGGETVDYASDTGVPGPLSPQTGTDINGGCWYYTTADTRYVFFTQFANGDAELGIVLDPSNPDGIISVGPILPRCTSEPTPAGDPLEEVWDYVTEYIHPPPTPDLSPSPGDGVTGLVTYLGVAVPDVHEATISSETSTIDVYIGVSAVVVDWDDGTVDSYPAIDEILTGYPDGAVTHTYETKSSGVAIGVSYDWSARWRLVGESWEPLDVPNTTTTVGYPVAEIVSDLTN